MAFWTPTNLRDVGYIVANLSDRDRSLALNQCLQYLPDALKQEADFTRQELELRNQLNDGPYSFRNVRDLRSRNNQVQNDPTATPEQKAAALTAYEDAQAQRDSLNVTYQQVNNNLVRSSEYVISLQEGINNLKSLGAIPTSDATPIGNTEQAYPQQVVEGVSAPITVVTTTPTLTSEPVSSSATFNEFSTDRQLSTNITTPINDFATDVQTQQEIVASDDAGTNAAAAGGGEDVPVDRVELNFLTPAADDENEINPDEFDTTVALDPNLTVLEDADNDEIQSNEDITNLAQLRSDIDDQDDLELVNSTTNTTSEFDELEQFDYPEPVESTETTLGTTEGETDEGNVVNEQVESTNTSSRSTNVSGATASTRNQADLQYGINFSALKDWRVKLKLAPDSNYFYNATSAADRGILAPLNETKGVIFPYTPNIVVNYVANYDTSLPSHSNYKIVQYQSSAVDNVSITCDFTAQDTKEANYLLAVIHFLRSVTKMFYGQDQNPKRGTPPPLCYLEGLGSFQFDMHPLVVQSFNYSLPNDVDYIRAMPATAPPGSNVNNSGQSSSGNSTDRLSGTGAAPGAVSNNPNFSTTTNGQTLEPTYIPTKMQIQINCMPVVSRKDISDTFSLKDYAKGTLLQGSKRAGGGIW